MDYNPYFPNLFDVLKETMFSGDFNYLIFVSWTSIVITGMFFFTILQFLFSEYQNKKWVLISEIVISIIVKFLLWVQFFPSMFSFTFYYFFIFILLYLFLFEYIKSFYVFKIIQIKFMSMLIIILLIYSFYLVSIRNLYNATYHLSDVYTKEDLYKYIR